MRLLLISLVTCVSLSFSDVQAQSPASNGNRPLVGTPSRFVPSDIDEKMVKQFNGAWQQCVLGTKDTEAVVLVLREPDGSVKAVSAGRSNQSYEFTFTWNPAIIAVVHTHPNNRDPKPVEQDILVARRFDIPIFTITRRGMHMYDPATDRITKVMNGTDWLDSSSWARASQLAANKPSQREPNSIPRARP
jgi:hypothetical protein